MAQPGRALGSGPRGRRFESSRPDHHPSVRQGILSGPFFVSRFATDSNLRPSGSGFPPPIGRSASSQSPLAPGGGASLSPRPSSISTTRDPLGSLFRFPVCTGFEPPTLRVGVPSAYRTLRVLPVASGSWRRSLPLAPTNFPSQSRVPSTGTRDCLSSGPGREDPNLRVGPRRQRGALSGAGPATCEAGRGSNQEHRTQPLNLPRNRPTHRLTTWRFDSRSVEKGSTPPGRLRLQKPKGAEARWADWDRRPASMAPFKSRLPHLSSKPHVRPANPPAPSTERDIRFFPPLLPRPSCYPPLNTPFARTVRPAWGLSVPFPIRHRCATLTARSGEFHR